MDERISLVVGMVFGVELVADLSMRVADRTIWCTSVISKMTVLGHPGSWCHRAENAKTAEECDAGRLCSMVDEACLISMGERDYLSEAEPSASVILINASQH